VDRRSENLIPHPLNKYLWVGSVTPKIMLNMIFKHYGFELVPFILCLSFMNSMMEMLFYETTYSNGLQSYIIV